MSTAASRTMRRHFYEILEGDDRHDAIGLIVHYLLITLICVSVLFSIIVTIPEVHDEWGFWFEISSVFIFSVFLTEYILRLWVSVEDPRRKAMGPVAARLSYARSFEGVIDLIAILPFIFVHLFHLDLRVFALLRLLRFLKLLRYSTGIAALAEAIVAERQTLLACLVVLMSVVTVSATVMYQLEGPVQPQAFGSIPLAMWWAMETVTTVGYGDIIPASPVGRIIGGITMIMGLIVLALPIAIVATSFSEVIRRRGFVVNWATLTRIPLFDGLSADVLAEILSIARAETYDAGNHVLRIGDNARSLYVIAVGDVEAMVGDETQRLSDGDAFGGPLRYGGAETDAVIRALTRTRIIVLPEKDLHSLLGRRPVFAARLKRLAKSGSEAHG